MFALMEFRLADENNVCFNEIEVGLMQ